ncbi:MAG: efflux RND transporter periplasmic adaptor subunit [Tannerella sp.]|jgi:RND family efflux transporter MFP subunit|nr:efflux RND transporter periplasmic adaptor subunit [Tannerella sp.]
MKMKTIGNIVIAATIIGLASWKLVYNKKEMDTVARRSLEINPVIPVRVSEARNMDMNNSIVVDGRIKARNEVTLYSKVQGIVLKKYKKAGDAVSKGMVIAQVENSVAGELLGLAEQNLANAAKDVERYKKLAEAGAVTQREYEAILVTCREAQRNVTELKELLANTTLVSPINGILETDYFEEGTLLGIGAQVADFIDPSGLKLVVNLTEKEVYKIKKGDKATVSCDILPDEEFTGTVDVIGSKGNDRLSYPAEILISSKNTDRLKPGIYASANFIPNGRTTDNSLVVNRKAIIESLKTPEVYVVKDNKAVKQKIFIGKIFDNFVEVTSGLNPGDAVVVAGQINLTDGKPVEIIK